MFINHSESVMLPVSWNSGSKVPKAECRKKLYYNFFFKKMKLYCKFCGRMTDNIDRVYDTLKLKIISILCKECQQNKNSDTVFHNDITKYIKLGNPPPK